MEANKTDDTSPKISDGPSRPSTDVNISGTPSQSKDNIGTDNQASDLSNNRGAQRQASSERVPLNNQQVSGGEPGTPMGSQEDGFVLVEADEAYRQEVNRASFFDQMNKYLTLQIKKCEHYRDTFAQQTNMTLSNKFSTLREVTMRDQELLLMAMNNNAPLPKFKFEHVNFNCNPINVDIREKELQIYIRTTNLSSESDALIYVIAEFEFPAPREESFRGSAARWLQTVKIEPKNMFCCSGVGSKQLDIIYSTDKVPFTTPDSRLVEYDRPFSFFVDKGKSRTLKRKFKLVRLTFYEKTRLLKYDKKIGTVAVKVDGINDDIQTVYRQFIMDGRKATEAVVDIKVRVREPLVMKNLRAHEEKIMLLTP